MNDNKDIVFKVGFFSNLFLRIINSLSWKNNLQDYMLSLQFVKLFSLFIIFIESLKISVCVTFVITYQAIRGLSLI